MLKKTAFHAGSLALTLMLCACAGQQPAPVISGTASTGSTAANSTGNPYGAAPYEPNAAAAADTAPYTPPAYTPSAPAANTPAYTGSYVPSYAPVDINAATHSVVRGDTVYNISKRYHITQDNLRAWNNLSDNTISIGQVLRVKPAGYVAPTVTAAPVVAAAVPAAPANPVSTPAPATKPAATAPAAAPASTPTVATGATRTVSSITWQRPTTGNVITQFGGSSKGVDIAGTAGQPVVAAADGKVVYAGSGLRGYGNLVIIQHNPTFLSAYGHNQSLLVSEGQSVKRGQTIAKMGNTDASRTQLHFEVRQNGKPVNPASYVAF
ncbi:peptidoglycan DD-metalloendopeptidase family protein [Neisseria sp. ZJ106]|uniref:Peptidoglycan DD-metalloendopeptidase family protein n=1 Tax=Neisseria lisongii TaxID=2912188 RepID=A0ABY7RKX7_9NEIS|nr:peptidoglycan DD-metalloendopeptidase family protein [Neisseria lisongii]MCF7521151.1 peptidoglycan DD-metalloendopeptidase family protein [Neisseria lisongii]WCL72072.1 peptidoglycan DD-metalloendopeptidase family protein [Neisseria lisongii]